MIIKSSVKSFSIWKIIFKLSSKVLTIGQVESSFALFHVSGEIALIFNPTVVYLVQVFPIQVFRNIDRTLIIKNSISMKLVLAPLSFISKLSISIVKCSSSLHFIFEPLSRISSPFLIIKRTKSVSHTILFISFKTTTTVLLCHIIRTRLSACFHDPRYVI